MVRSNVHLVYMLQVRQLKILKISTFIHFVFSCAVIPIIYPES